jgi:hypothetical protein
MLEELEEGSRDRPERENILEARTTGGSVEGGGGERKRGR